MIGGLSVDIDQLMRTPLLAEILRVLAAERGQWTAEQLAERTGAPYATVTRDVRRLERSGVIGVEVAGRTKLLSLDTTDPIVRALARTMSLGPPPRGGDMAKKKSKKKDGKKKGKKK